MAISIPNIGEVIVARSADGCWDFTLPYAGGMVWVSVKLSSDELTQAKLEPVLDYFANISAFDAMARAAIAREHSRGGDDTVRSYIDHHLEEFSALELLQCFGRSEATAVGVELFLSKLKLHHIGLYPEGSEDRAVFDFTIDKALTDYVLAVGFDRKGKPVWLAMES